MKNLAKAIVFGLVTAVAAGSAMAAPQNEKAPVQQQHKKTEKKAVKQQPKKVVKKAAPKVQKHQVAHKPA
ncbi:MAG: hypothetical protein QM666_07675 [Acinetobacter sp.]